MERAFFDGIAAVNMSKLKRGLLNNTENHLNI